MEVQTHNNRSAEAETITLPSRIEGTGSALRRAFPAPGALGDDMLRLLRALDDPDVSRPQGD